MILPSPAHTSGVMVILLSSISKTADKGFVSINSAIEHVLVLTSNLYFNPGVNPVNCKFSEKVLAKEPTVKFIIFGGDKDEYVGVDPIVPWKSSAVRIFPVPDI